MKHFLGQILQLLFPMNGNFMVTSELIACYLLCSWMTSESALRMYFAHSP